MKKYIYLSLVIVGCYNVKKATKQLNKANDNYPEIVAKKTAEWYPCIPYDHKTDSSEYKLWLKSFDSINNLYLGSLSLAPAVLYSEVHDTIVGKCLDKKAIIQYKEVIKRMPPIHDTIYKIDSSKNFIVAKEKKDCEADRLDILKKYLKFKSYLIWLLIALCMSMCLNLIQLKFRK